MFYRCPAGSSTGQTLPSHSRFGLLRSARISLIWDGCMVFVSLLMDSLLCFSSNHTVRFPYSILCVRVHVPYKCLAEASKLSGVVARGLPKLLLGWSVIWRMAAVVSAWRPAGGRGDVPGCASKPDCLIARNHRICFTTCGRMIIFSWPWPSISEGRGAMRDVGSKAGQISLLMLSAARFTSRKMSPSLAWGLASTVITASGPA